MGHFLADHRFEFRPVMAVVEKIFRLPAPSGGLEGSLRRNYSVFSFQRGIKRLVGKPTRSAQGAEVCLTRQVRDIELRSRRLDLGAHLAHDPQCELRSFTIESEKLRHQFTR